MSRALHNPRLLAVGSALAAVAGLAAAPFILWHRLFADTLASFQWALTYFAGELGPWILLVSGTAFLLPVALSAGLHPESRFYPRGRGVYFIWGVVLYLLGAVLAVQAYDLWNYAH